MKLKRNVVMLPTNDKAAPILSYLDDKSLQYFPNEYWSNVNLTKRHLYITSDEEIKEGDWYIDDTNNVRQSVTSDAAYWSVRKDYRKIIATTDKSLTISEIIYPEEFVHVMPSPSDSFIKKFIEKYNAGTPITEVMVEYEEYPITTYGMSDGEPETDTRLKVDKNNCITITAVKDTFTRKDMIEFGQYAFAMANSTKDTSLSFEELLDNFEQTLKS